MQSTRLQPTWRVVEQVFHDYGLPDAMQSDNGAPFGPAGGTFSSMAVRLMALDIQPVFSRPARPSDNGRHERMHRELKREATRPASQTFQQQQKRFDDFRRIYNEERPHEGIGMNRPARRYTPSRRPYPTKKPQPQYDTRFEVRKVSQAGQISWRNHLIFISEVFAGRQLGFEPIDDDVWCVHFHRFSIGKIDERTNEFF